MAEFTKEQLIERARENVNSLKFASTQHAFEQAFPAIEIDIRLAEIALAALTAPPFMYGIADPDGAPHFDEECVGSDAGILQDKVDCLNDAACGGDGPRGVESDEYRVVPLYRLPEIE